MQDKVHEEASFVEAVDGIVSVEGPNGVSVLLTAEAAEETSERLLDGALTARGQKLAAKDRPTRSR